MTPSTPPKEPELGAPFPLRSRFRTRILPGLLVFVIILSSTLWLGTNRVMQSIYLDLARHRVATIAHALASAAPSAWAQLLSGQTTTLPASIEQPLRDEIQEQRIRMLKLYLADGHLIFDSARPILADASLEALVTTVAGPAGAQVIAKTDTEGHSLYELYIGYPGDGAAARLVFELYEPADQLDAILLRNALTPIGLGALMFGILVLALNRLVGDAQADIDRRTSALDDVRLRLETLVSRRAVNAARSNHAIAGNQGQRIHCVILYSDVRGFTPYSERHSPEQVVAYLNRIMTLQIRAIEQHAGDVDKLVGDAILARFEGPAAARNAIATARAILAEMRATSLRPGIGIGIFSGEVVAGSVGPEHRRDFTIIGDTVNMAARLCTAAREGELVVDQASVDAAGFGELGQADTIEVKGKTQALGVYRFRQGH